MSAETLMGLAISRGPWNMVMPSPADLHSLGPQWVRYLPTFPFQDLETGQNTELDVIVEHCRELGIRLLVLVNHETLGENLPRPGATNWGDRDSGYIRRMADLAQKIASFYRNRLGAIELFSEPDSHQVSPEDYAALLRACYRKIKAVSPVPVISAGICCGKNYPYLRRVIQNSSGAFDGVGWHPFGLEVEGYPARGWGYGDLRDSLVRARAIAGKPLWLTEFGAALEYNWPPGLPPEEAVATYLRSAYALLRQLGPDTVAQAFWFTWQDLNGGWGLVDKAGIRRPSWYAFQQQTHPAPPEISQMTINPTTMESGQLLNISITVRNHSADTLATQGPEPGFVYEEGDSFDSRGMPTVPQAFRVGIDFDERTGIDHPYRWGLGAPLAPGESTTITGSIKLKTARSQNYWAGLVQERVAWVQDRRGVQNVIVRRSPQMTEMTIEPSSLNAGDLHRVNITRVQDREGMQPAAVLGPVDEPPDITGVVISPTKLESGKLLNVTITVNNNSKSPLPTQGPEPGTVYEEGDSFYAHGFPAIPGAFRVGIDFDGRTGIDYPYRWGFGTPLAPGESRVITGAIRLKTARSVKYWAGLLHEQVAWVQNRAGTQTIQVTASLTGTL